jgi:hypothetical protein
MLNRLPLATIAGATEGLNVCDEVCAIFRERSYVVFGKGSASFTYSTSKSELTLEGLPFFQAV